MEGQSFTTADGCHLRYRLRGKGPLIALTPGGREGGEGLAAFADELAQGATVLTWDRRNCGASDIWFGGDSEADVWADDLSDLITHLGLGPAWLAGGSAGCRVSVLSALRRPETARGLLLWSASGGAYSIAQNPANRDRLLAMDPVAFAQTLKRWNRAFYYDPAASLAGVADAALGRLSIPTLLVSGNDDVHPPSVSDALARLIPNAKLIPSPWSNADWLDKFTMRTSGTVFDLYPLLVPALREFLAAHACPGQ